MVDASHNTSASGAIPAAQRPNGWLIASAAIALTLAAFFFVSRFGHRSDPELDQRLSRLSHVVWIGDEAPRVSMEAKQLSALVTHPDLERTFGRIEHVALHEGLRKERVDGVLVKFAPNTKPRTTTEQMQAFAHVHGLRADYLTARWALYLPDPLQSLSPTLQSALATVARGVLGGQRAPRVTSFPEPLRQVQNVEVMVMVRRDGRALLWRSARGSSIARALLMAAQMARRRWIEREQALGGSIDRLLPELEIEVALLHEDGTLGERDAAFVDRVFTPRHGVAYERRGSWHYSLPEATQRDGHGAASKAYAKLFDDNGLPPTSLEREELRLYRLVMTTLAVSPPTDTGENDPGRVTTPDDVLRGLKDEVR